MSSPDRNVRSIGGYFAIDPTHAKPPFSFNNAPIPVLDSKTYWLNARSALQQILLKLKLKRVWLPSYICPSILYGVPESIRLMWYDVSLTDQTFDSTILSRNIMAGDGILAIDYFGIWNIAGLISQGVPGNIPVINDCCMRLPSSDHLPETGQTYQIYSLRKVMAVPDGAILSTSRGIPLPAPDMAAPPVLAEAACECRVARHQADHGCPSHDGWFARYQEVEASQPTGSFAMSDVSHRVIENFVQWDKFADKRRENYQYLRKHLAPYALFRETGEHAVPLGFPCRFENRDRVAHELHIDHIYAAVHWNLKDAVPQSFTQAHALSKNILTLPCDQRYGLNEMEYVVQAVRRILEA